MSTTRTRPSPPLKLRDQRPTPANAVGVSGIRTEDHAAFREFVDSHHNLMRDYLDRRLRGTHEVSPEDVLQDALIRIWKQFSEWPTDPERRIIFLRQALKVAAIDAIRSRRGRNGTAPREYPVDFTDLERGQRTDTISDHVTREIGQILARDALEQQSDGPERIQRSVLLASCAALTDLERRALFMTARGDNGVQISRDLGASHQQVREALMRARRLVRSLIEHADAGKLRPEEAKTLWELRDGKLSGRPKREAQRHVDHCSTCQRILGIEQGVSDAGVRVFLPLPALALVGGLFGTGAGTAVVSAGASSGTAGAAGTAGAHAASGVAATSGLLSGVTAKAAVVLAGLAVSGSALGTYKLIEQPHHPTHQHTPALVRVIAGDQPPVDYSATVNATPPPSHHRRATQTKHHKKIKHATPHVAAVTATQPSTPRTVTAPTARAATTHPTKAPSRSKPPSAGSAGGEFVLSN